MMTGLLCLLYIVHLCFEKMAVQSSSHNCPTDSSECLKLSSTSASEASWETFGRCKLYHALAVMLSPLGIITWGALATYGTYCWGFPSPRARLWWLVPLSIILVNGGGG